MARKPGPLTVQGTVQVAIVGGGPAGLTAAIALAQAGVETALIARPAAPDHRTTALLAGSVTALETLGAWTRCRAHAAPLKVMRIVDDTARLIRAPEVSFAAEEIGLPAFGHNIENRHLLDALEARTSELALAAAHRWRSPCRRSWAGGCDHPSRRRRQHQGQARDRRRRPAFALPRRGRHRNRRLAL